MLRVYDATSRYVDQGGGRRPGAFAVYVEPWHADIFDVLNLKKKSWKGRTTSQKFVLRFVGIRLIHETCS